MAPLGFAAADTALGALREGAVTVPDHQGHEQQEEEQPVHCHTDGHCIGENAAGNEVSRQPLWIQTSHGTGLGSFHSLCWQNHFTMLIGAAEATKKATRLVTLVKVTLGPTSASTSRITSTASPGSPA